MVVGYVVVVQYAQPQMYTFVGTDALMVSTRFINAVQANKDGVVKRHIAIKDQ